MKSPNPYEPPRTDSQLEELETPRIYVDGPHLVIASGVELPRRCVKTNHPVSEKGAMHQTLEYSGRTFQFTVSKWDCEIVWYATPRIVWRHRARIIAQLLMWPSFLFPLFFLESNSIWPKPILVFAIIMLLLFVIIRPTLRFVNYKNNRFWIKGCCRKFLESLQNELQNGRDSP